VNIPIAVYPATREQKIAFKQLRKSDLSPIRLQKVAEADMEEAPLPTRSVTSSTPIEPVEEIVKGYEYEKGKFVALTRRTSRR